MQFIAGSELSFERYLTHRVPKNFLNLKTVFEIFRLKESKPLK